MARPRLKAGRVTPAAIAALLVTLPACGEPEPAPATIPAEGGAEVTGAVPLSPTYEQSFVFASVNGDSALFVPWILRTTARPDSVAREARAWLGRSGAWEAFFAERWNTPPTRAPGRILPFGNFDILVQEGDAVDGILFAEGARKLELALGEVEASWGGPRGEAIELIDGDAYLSDRRVDGVILHMARASTGGAHPGGDWALLLSGDSVRLVLAADAEQDDTREPAYRGWAEIADQDRIWTDVRVTWDATQAFPPARRDVPVAWRISSDDGSIEGSLQVVSSDIQAGEGPGPLLPVRAIYDVSGTMATLEGTFPVRGVLFHERR